MKIDLTCQLPCSLAQAAAQARRPGLLHHVAHPLVQFRAQQPQQLPDIWQPGCYEMRMYLFGLIPLGRQTIVISFPEHGGGFALRDNGHGSLVRRWDHLITLTPNDAGTCYRDQVAIEAGWLTWPVWLFAQLFYRHRQRRWRQLAARDFEGV
ncbi:hypothetical protein [Vandammella animalimorsus]|uniref:Uncharacterized protein n=1 Tax=Vandammella animalimorsus TaxID=2029117 RepID=A0A2A2B078_9BURK|nr:hypothetical protein [Vandammella animalimorsus]PAT43476.1 hypothetical protein CK621_03050 [Vandammella animalimorsus]